MILLVAAKPAPDKYELINSLPIAGKSISTDQLRNVYVVTQNNLVERYDSSGTLTGRFSENRYGNLNIVDASSPFNLLYFYADTKTVLTGDVKMNVKNLFKLSTIGINLPRAACLSYDNYIWVFDGSDNKLKKVNNNYEITYTSEDITMFVGQSINPNFIVERDGFIFLNDPGLGILVFDRYGTYYNAFPIPGLSSFQVIKNMVLYQDGNSLRIYNYSTRETKSIPLPTTEPIKSIRLERGRLFILTETELKIYSESE
jgi:hypothetical protein